MATNLKPALDLSRYVLPFTTVKVKELDNGYIVWRTGTGFNTELLHLKVYVPRQGTGKQLIKEMLKALSTNPPWATVFGFALPSNVDAINFYQAMGFDLSLVDGVYACGRAVVFSANYLFLKERHDA